MRLIILIKWAVLWSLFTLVFLAGIPLIMALMLIDEAATTEYFQRSGRQMRLKCWADFAVLDVKRRD